MSGTATETEPARALLARLCDDLVDLPGGWTSSDPLEWPGYREQLERAALRSGETESVIAATATIAGTPVVALAFDFRFLGGSMGEATGRRIVAALRHAFEARLPVVSFVASGGARMQEGMRSLVQMQEIAAAVARLRAGGIPHLSVLRHPTTGGVWASFAATADVIVAMRGGIVSFAGPRVRGDEHELDAAFTAEGKVAAGFADRVVDAVELPDVLARYVGLLGRALRQGAVGAPAPCGADAAREPSRGGWETVVAARDAARPRAGAFLDACLSERVPLSGDRVGGVDASMLCGLGLHEGDVVAYVAQTGAPNAPAGFRTARRVLELAERLRIPVLTLIDTPGAANDAEAERQGVGTAIAELFATVASLTVPATSVVIGEGGSGGALALAAPGRLYAAPDSFFAVIAPEAAAAILHRDRSRAREVAELLALRPCDLVRLGIVRPATPGDGGD